ncbi:MAG: phosphoglycolate phosphatase [Alphaproteobacteria bacterium]|nr:phosphoglycolate phosphatase [Alphaproteobacteria bacterium]
MPNRQVLLSWVFMMPPVLRKRSFVVFDLDGTLIHIVPDLRVALNGLLIELGGRSLEADEVRQMVGAGVDRLIERAMTAAALSTMAWEGGLAPLVRRFLEIYESAPTALTRCWPGAETVLETLIASGYWLGLCTNKPHRATLDILAQLDLTRFFSAVVGGDSTSHIKPDPRPLMATLDALGARLDEAVMVGDSANDVGVARNAGIPVIVVSFGYAGISPQAMGADAVIDAFSELPAALEGLC